MSKRSSNFSDSGKPKQAKNWSLGLLDSMNDPNSVVKETKQVVVIKDKYPKAKVHLLALPRDDLKTISKLNSSHVSLLEEFSKLFEEFKEEYSDFSLMAGFHAVPSMQRLHMHIISKDMISPCLKTKVHWNSFTTKFFIPLSDLINELKTNGSIKPISQELHKSFMATPLLCNQCNFEPKNMPKLKEHLVTHDKNK